MSNFNIDPSKLTGDWLKWAQEAEDAEGNTQKDGVLLNSAFEKDFVKTKAVQAGKSSDEISAFFASVKAEEPKDTTGIMGGEFKLKRTARNAKQDNVLQYLQDKEVLPNPLELNWETVAANFDKVLDKPKDNPAYYAKLQNVVHDVASAFKEVTKSHPYNNKDDVEKLSDEVEKKLNISKDDELKDFKRDVIKQFAAMAEANQFAKEEKAVHEAYKDLRAKVNPETNKKYTTAEAMDAVGDDDKFSGSYYKKAIKAVNKKALDDAEKIVYAAIDAQIGNGLKNSRQVEKEAIKILKEQGEYNEHTKKILGGQLTLAEKMKFDMSRIKAYRKSVVIDDRVEKKKGEDFTIEQFYKNLKDNKLAERLVNSELITQNKDEQGRVKPNSYNITPLSQTIRQRVGSDLRAAGQTKDLYAYDEVENIVKKIAAETGLPDVKTSDVKSLIKMCGFEIIGKNWVKITVDTLIDSAATLVPGAGAAMAGVGAVTAIASLNLDKIIPMKINVDKSLNLNLDIDIGDIAEYADFNEDDFYMGLPQELWKYVDIQDTGTGWNISINKQLIESKDLALNLKDLLSDEDIKDLQKSETKDCAPQVAKALGRLATVTVAANFLKRALAKESGELPILNTQFNETSREEYNKIIDADKKLTPKEKQAIKFLASTFVEKDESGNEVWLSEKYKNFLNAGEFSDPEKYENPKDSSAGDGSFLSRNELHSMLHRRQLRAASERKKFVNKEPDKIVEKKVEEKPITKVPEVKTNTIDPFQDAEEVDLEPNYNLGNKHTWKGFVALYDESAEPGTEKYKKIVKAIKEVNGIKANDTVIPADLYLPPSIEGIGNAKKALNDADIERFLYDHDMKVRKGDAVSNGTNRGKVFRGFEQYGNDQKTRGYADGIYKNAETAKEAAKGKGHRPQ